METDEYAQNLLQKCLSEDRSKAEKTEEPRYNFRKLPSPHRFIDFTASNKINPEELPSQNPSWLFNNVRSDSYCWGGLEHLMIE